MEPKQRKKAFLKLLIGGFFFLICFASLFYWLVFLVTTDSRNAQNRIIKFHDDVDIATLQHKISTYLSLEEKKGMSIGLTENEVSMLLELLPKASGLLKNIDLGIKNRKFVAQMNLPINEIYGLSLFPFLGNRCLSGDLVFSVRKFDEKSWVLHFENFKTQDDKIFALNYFLVTEKLPKEWLKIKSVKIYDEAVLIEG